MMCESISIIHFTHLSYSFPSFPSSSYPFPFSSYCFPLTLQVLLWNWSQRKCCSYFITPHTTPRSFVKGLAVVVVVAAVFIVKVAVVVAVVVAVDCLQSWDAGKRNTLKAYQVKSSECSQHLPLAGCPLPVARVVAVTAAVTTAVAAVQQRKRQPKHCFIPCIKRLVGASVHNKQSKL